MKPAAFAYLRPASLEEAVTVLAGVADDGKVLAGGQSLVAAMNFRLARPGVLVDLNRIGDPGRLEASPEAIAIGVLTRHAEFHRPLADTALAHALARVVRHIAHYPIRQRGTFAGSLCHADPASEWCLVAATLDAEMTATSTRGERRIAARDFFRGTFRTALEPDEILTRIVLPGHADGWTFGFEEFARRAGDFALAMSFAALKIEGGLIRDARLGVGGVSDRPVRLHDIELHLVGQVPGAEAFAAAAEAASRAVEPTEDIHATAEYRCDLIRAMVRRALTQAAR